MVSVLVVRHDVVAVDGRRQRALVLEAVEPGLRAAVQREVALVGQRAVARVTVRGSVRLATNILVRRPIHAFAAAPPAQHAGWRAT